MTRRELVDYLSSVGEPIYGAREAAQIARMVLDEVCGVSFTQLVADPDKECVLEELDSIVKDISSGRPIQYIIGEADFCSMRLNVREGVLIPRPESEELIQWIVSEAKGDERILDKRILDIGTGSGALAIALSCALSNSDVTALDLSREALEIARENGAKYAPRVKFLEGDALLGVEKFVEGEFDIILSNPPYIPQREMDDMRQNVVDFEPHLALFVPDDDPLLFYRRIARSAKELLREGGKLYYEIHENFAQETARMVESEGFVDVQIRHDINDKARMICASRG